MTFPAENSVDLETGVVAAVTVQSADRAAIRRVHR